MGARGPLGRMAPSDQHSISAIELWPLDIPLTDPFVVAGGSRTVAQNVCVRLSLAGGAQGYGEMAPLPEVGGEDRPTSLAQAEILAKGLIGKSALRYRSLAHELLEQAPTYPAARCALETALLDALCRANGIPLWGLWGGGDVRPRESDITIPITDLDRTLALARAWYAKGFRLFKMKVGHDVEDDIRRVEAVHRHLAEVSLIIDANQGYGRAEAVAMTEAIRRCGGRLLLLEQPLAREDLEGLAALRHGWKAPIAADESVRSVEDARRVLHYGAADFINIKIMKTGVIHALEIAAFARAAGLHLMIGGMVETRLAMGCSFGMVLGLGGFEVLDLDTPLLLAEDPVQGGFRYQGPTLHPWEGSGLDLNITPPASAVLVGDSRRPKGEGDYFFCIR